LDTRESVRVDLPWSTWAITDMFRMFSLLSMHARTWSVVKFTWNRIFQAHGTYYRRTSYYAVAKIGNIH
jgi:hypothetical protein